MPASVPIAEAPTSPNVTVEDLAEIIRSFNDVGAQLQATQAQLQAEVVRLQQELAEANEQLRRSRSLAALGEMAAGIAHEIRNPLGAIQLDLQTLTEDLRGQDEPLGMCARIGRAVEHLDAIVRDVLAFSRDMRINPAPTTPATIVERTLHSTEALMSGRDITIERDADPAVAESTCTVDELLIVQALANVVRNAVEAMTEAGVPDRTVCVSVHRQVRRCPDGRRARRIVYGVADSGPGIPDEVVKRIFNPFFTTRHTGTGLGLAIVHRIIDAHGGHVSVGRAPGGGALVELCVPRTVRVHEATVAADEVSLAASVQRRLSTEQSG